MNQLTIYGISMPAWIIIPVVFLVWITFFTFFKRVAFRALKKVADSTKTKLDDIVIGAADLPLTLLIYSSAAAVVERLIPLAFNVELTTSFLMVFKAASIIAVVLFVDKLLTSLLYNYSDRVEVLKSSGSIARGFVRILVIGLGCLILLDSFGVSITPIIASLGIGSLAVALALQPTLENFFSGIQIVIDKPVKIGHFVKLDSGEEGYVHKIGWRSTWVRPLNNTMVIIPNKILVSSKILNYYYPEPEMAALVQVGVHYASDLDHVEKVTIEVANQTLKEVTGGVKDFNAFIRYHTFDSSSINFTVILRVKEFVDNYLIKHEFIKRLQKRYHQEGIVIPFPIRAINYDQEKAFQNQPEFPAGRKN